MVLHSHMLNPRAFLEDTMRHGLGMVWSSGLPWNLLKAAITEGQQYNVSSETMTTWIGRTGRNWKNQDDPLIKRLKCPYCPAEYDVPWTSCGRSSRSNNTA